MPIKDIAKQVIDSLSDEATMDDIIHALYVKTKFEHGEREIREGKGMPEEEALMSINGMQQIADKAGSR